MLTALFSDFERKEEEKAIESRQRMPALTGHTSLHYIGSESRLLIDDYAVLSEIVLCSSCIK